MSSYSLRSVLLVDDDNDVFHLVALALRRSSLCDKVLWECEGSLGLHRLFSISESSEPQWPEVLLIDINLPDMDGFHFLREWQTFRISRQIPIIPAFLLTNLAPPDAHLYSQGISDLQGILEKPLQSSSLPAVLRKAGLLV